jgi:hypothetical protein
VNTYEHLLGKINLEIMRGKNFSDLEKQEIVNRLLGVASGNDTVSRFHKSVKAPEYLYYIGKSDDKRKMYPMFFIPPYNEGKKLRLITGELPKTHLLASNHYELEILRILILFDKNNPTVKNMVKKTIERLDTTCFAHWCPTGECVGAGISVLRFLSALRPRNDEWINKILVPLLELEKGGKGGTYYIKVNIPFYYMLTAVSEIANDLCREFISSRINLVPKSTGLTDITISNLFIPTKRRVRPNTLDEYDIERFHTWKNALSILPEFEYLKSIK